MTEDFIDVYKGDILKLTSRFRNLHRDVKANTLARDTFQKNTRNGSYEKFHLFKCGVGDDDLNYSIHPCLLTDLLFIEKYWGVNHPNLEVGHK